MHDQASYLLDLMSVHRQLELRILPFTADIPFVDSDFQLLLFDNIETSDLAYVEDSRSPHTRGKKFELKRFREHWAALSAAALDTSEIKEFLAELIS